MKIEIKSDNVFESYYRMYFTICGVNKGNEMEVAMWLARHVKDGRLRITKDVRKEMSDRLGIDRTSISRILNNLKDKAVYYDKYEVAIPVKDFKDEHERHVIQIEIVGK